MQFYGFYNAFGSGTEVITGGANANLASAEDVVSNNPNIYFNGQYSNLSRQLIHLTFYALRQNGTTTLHKHDIRPYESIDLRNIPLNKLQVFVPANASVGFHGMGVLTLIEDEDERAVALTKSSISESLRGSPNFNTDIFNKNTITTATTTTLWTPVANSSIGLYKLNMACAGAQTIEVFFTDSASANPRVIGLYRFGAEGTYTMDFDVAMLRNPHGDGGLLRATTTTTASTQIDTIGHDILESQ